MPPITPAERARMAGIPSQSEQDINLTPEGLITGDYPAKSTEDVTVAANQTIPAYTPVGFNAAGNIVVATLTGDPAVPAIGVTFYDIVTGAAPLRGVPIYRSGVFNPDFLNFHEDYDTLEKRLEAFRGAPTPTQIIMRPIKTATVTLP